MRETPVQANRMLALLSKMFGLAERWGLRPSGSNPCRGIDRFPERRRERFLSAAEPERFGAILDEEEPADPFVVLAIRPLLLSGARRDEALNLRWSEVNFERARLSLPDSKTGAKLIPLGPPARAVLVAAPRLDDNPYVIPGRRVGGRLVGLQRPWASIREQAGLGDLQLHDLRHARSRDMARRRAWACRSWAPPSATATRPPPPGTRIWPTIRGRPAQLGSQVRSPPLSAVGRPRR
jgi:integrase